MSVIAEARNISKIYHHESTPVLALNQVSCEIEAGEFLSIMGPSGAGKSTLLNCLAGLLKPDQGQVIVNGVDIYDISESKLSRFRNENIGYIFQAFNLLPSMTVLQNVRLPGYIGGRKTDEEFEKEVFKTLGIQDRLGFYPDQLSGGEQQRVAIARAVLINPSIIIADEPTGNLDSKNSQQFMQLMRELRDKFNQTIVMVTHNPELAEEADRLITIEDGKITEDKILRPNKELSYE
jgi:putative ABC transport system ATP-binding protein